MYTYVRVCISLPLYIYVSGVRLPTDAFSAVSCCKTRRSACGAAFFTHVLHSWFDHCFLSTGRTLLPPCPGRFILALLTPVALLLGPFLFVISSTLPPTALQRLQATKVNGLQVISTALLHTSSQAACPLRGTCPLLVVEGTYVWRSVATVFGAFARRGPSKIAVAQTQRGSCRSCPLQSLFPECIQTLLLSRDPRKWAQQQRDATARTLHAAPYSLTGRRRCRLRISSSSGWRMRPFLFLLSFSTFDCLKRVDSTARRVPVCCPPTLPRGTPPQPFQADTRWRAKDRINGAIPSEGKLARSEGRLTALEQLGTRDVDVQTGRRTRLSAGLLPASLLGNRETVPGLGFFSELLPIGLRQLVKTSNSSLVRNCSLRNGQSQRSQCSAITRLHMARSRSKPIHREAHPGLKQLILREKFWMRFDPAKNKLVHTPEYDALLLRDSQQLTPGTSLGEQQLRHKGKALTGECEAAGERPEGQLELSAEQRADLQAREVAYRRQQPRFRAKRWGSGRWKKEEAYVLRLLASHREKVLQHELQKVRRCREAAERLHKHRSDVSSAVNPEAQTGASGGPDTSASIREGGNPEQQPASVEAKVASLSYSFILKEVMPRLAALEQTKQQQALMQWKSYERQRELQQRRRLQQLAQRLGKADEDGSPGDSTATRMSEGLPLSDTRSILGQLQEIPQKKKMLMQKSSLVLSLPQQQQLFLGRFETLSKNLASKPQYSQDSPKGREQHQLLRKVSVRTREAYLQFLADLHFVFTSFEKLLTDGVDTLLRQPGRQEVTKAEVCAPGASGVREAPSPLPAVTGESSHRSGRQASETASQPQAWRNPESLEEFISCLSFQRGTNSGDDLVAVCELLKRSPPPPSRFVEAFVLDISELQQNNFLRALSRIYHFHKEWHVAGRWFLGWLTRRQQLLPKRLKMTMWDADTNSLELGIDLLSLSWSSAEKATFLSEFTYANEAAEAALTQPLLEGIEAAHSAALRDE